MDVLSSETAPSWEPERAPLGAKKQGFETLKLET